MRLRDLGGMIVVDFIDMVLQENRDLVLRRFTEFMGRDRTHHRVSEVTSLGLVQVTRKRLGSGLLETFSTTCEACEGRGVIVHADPVGQNFGAVKRRDHAGRKERQQAKREQRRREEYEEKRSRVEEKVHDDVAVDSSPKREQSTEHEAPVQDAERRQSDDGANTRKRRVRRVVRRGSRVQPESSEQPSKLETVDTVTGAGASVGAGADTDDLASTKAVDSSSAQEVRSARDTEELTQGAQRPQRSRRARRTVRRRTSVSNRDAVSKVSKVSKVPQADATVQSSQETFEEAQQAFEKSPRRKRRTRGNSRSDIPPRPEDYGISSQAKNEKNDHMKGEIFQESTGAESESSAASSGRRRRVRRVVRKSQA